MSSKVPISTIILKILSEKKAFSEDDLLYQLRQRLMDKTDEKPYYGISRSVRNLVSGGHIEPFETGQTLFLRITPLGRQKLLSTILDSKTALASTVWDGFWRIVILDLPEARKSEREAVRYLLRKAGFRCLKNSVWVSPYPFEHLIYEIKKHLLLKDEIIIFVTNTVDAETESYLRRAFRIG